MNVISIIADGVLKAVSALYGVETEASKLNIGLTRKEFEGDYTLVTFPFVKAARKDLSK